MYTYICDIPLAIEIVVNTLMIDLCLSQLTASCMNINTITIVLKLDYMQYHYLSHGGGRH